LRKGRNHRGPEKCLKKRETVNTKHPMGGRKRSERKKRRPGLNRRKRKWVEKKQCVSTRGEGGGGKQLPGVTRLGGKST